VLQQHDLLILKKAYSYLIEDLFQINAEVKQVFGNYM